MLAIATPPGQGVALPAIARCVDLTLALSGEQFQVKNLVEIARWGHFDKVEYPWEHVRRL